MHFHVVSLRFSFKLNLPKYTLENEISRCGSDKVPKETICRSYQTLFMPDSKQLGTIYLPVA